MTTQTHLPSHWIRRTLVFIDAPATHENQRFMEAWQRAEGGEAKWNPLNTTLNLGGTVNWTDHVPYNEIPVQNYLYGIVGIAATGLTLSQRNQDGSMVYAGVLADLKAGTRTAESMTERNDAEIRHWGTSPDLMLEVLKSIP